MDELILLSKLIDLAEQIGLTVRRAPAMGDMGTSGGGFVRLGKTQMLFLDPTAPTADQLSVAVSALKGRPELDDQFVIPEIRALLEDD